MTDMSNPIYHDETAARKHLEAIRWPDGPYCPFCGVMDEVKALGGKSMGPGWYHCESCRKKFTVRVGTVYERSKVPLHKWILATQLMCASKKGISAHQLHRTLGVTYKTAWFMAHRIREGMKPSTESPFGGKGKSVEVDETYHGTPKNKYRSVFVTGRGWVQCKGPMVEKSKIVTLVERGGGARSFAVDSVNTKTLNDIMFRNIDRESTLQTDKATWYKDGGREFAKHETVKHSLEEYVRGDAHTNSIEGYFSIFKRGMKGVYQHCQEKHLPRYLAEFDFRYNERAKIGVDDDLRTAKALRGISRASA